MKIKNNIIFLNEFAAEDLMDVELKPGIKRVKVFFFVLWSSKKYYFTRQEFFF